MSRPLALETLFDVVNTIELLQCMYCGHDEFQFRSDQDADVYNQLKCLCDLNTVETDYTWPEFLCFDVNLPIHPEAGTASDSNVQQPIILSLSCQVALKTNDFQISISSSNNPWMSRNSHQMLTEAIKSWTPVADERASRMLEIIQHVQAEAEPVISEAVEAAASTTATTAARVTVADDEPVWFVREWIWFPMIYTKEKRGHIINWAPKYSITGFLCPGKPGALCLEGPEKNVARFINDIKTISWSDIPASHRKMTSKWQERYECTSTEAMQQLRHFTDMKEVTFDLHGAFGNHNDLNMLQQWMHEQGCGAAFNHLFNQDVSS